MTQTLAINTLSPLKHNYTNELTEGLIRSGSDTNEYVFVDTLIARDIIANASEGKFKSEILFFSFVLPNFKWKMTRKNIIRNGRFSFFSGTENMIPSDFVQYFNFDVSNYTISETSLPENYTRVIFLKNSDMFAKASTEQSTFDEDDFVPNNNPLILIRPNEDISSLEKKVELYSLIEKTTTHALLPDLTKPMLLASHINNLVFGNNLGKSEEEKAPYFKVNEALAITFLELYNAGTSVNDASELSDEEKTQYYNAVTLLNYFYSWVDYFFLEFTKAEMLRPTVQVINCYDIKIFELNPDSEFIATVLKKGLKSGRLAFTSKNSFNFIQNFNQFLEDNTPIMNNGINSIVVPIHKKGDVPFDVKNIIKKVSPRQMKNAQMDIIAAGLKALNRNKSVMINGEPGVGKTSISLLTAITHAINRGQKMKLLVVCPGTITYSTWLKECTTVLYNHEENINVHVISSTAEIQELEKRGIFEDDEHQVVIVSENNLKSEFSNKPSVRWSPSKGGFQCPTCGHTISHRTENELHEMNPSLPKFITKPRGFDFFTSEKDNNTFCDNCSDNLWTPVNSESTKKENFIYISKNKKKGNVLHGFFPRNKHALIQGIQHYKRLLTKNKITMKREKHLEKCVKELEELIIQIEDSNFESTKQSKHEASIATYIEKKLKYKFTHLILDEAHEYQNLSKRFNAAKKVIKSIQFVICATGTSMNGYAKSRFRMDFLLFPEKMLKHGFNHDDIVKYQRTFGVTEEVSRFRIVRGKESRSQDTPKDKPGISPVIFPLFMQDTCLFLELKDVSDDLPPLTYEQVEVPLTIDLVKAQDDFVRSINVLTERDEIDFISALTTNVSFLDTPQKSREIIGRNGEVVYTSPSVEPEYDGKLNALKEVIRKELATKRNCMIYTQWTGDGINEYLFENLTAEFNITLLAKSSDYSYSCDGSKVKVKKDERVNFIQSELAKGTNVLIVSPELVKTGMNLIEFPTIIYYQLSYNVYTLRQADKRAHRYGQEKPCKVIYLYYRGTTQSDIASVMSTKIVASQAIEGKLDAAGLEAILNERTPEEELQMRFHEGLKKAQQKNV